MDKNVVKVQTRYQDLSERYQEMSDLLSSLLDDARRNETDIRYLTEFLHYKNLESEFSYFRKHAHEVYEQGQPFAYLSL